MNKTILVLSGFLPRHLCVQCSSSAQVAMDAQLKLHGCPSFFINENSVIVAEVTHGAGLWVTHVLVLQPRSFWLPFKVSI